MYVCVCRNITEKHIHKAARKGIHQFRELRYELGVATLCKRCTACAKACLNDAINQQKLTAAVHQKPSAKTGGIPAINFA